MCTTRAEINSSTKWWQVMIPILVRLPELFVKLKVNKKLKTH